MGSPVIYDLALPRNDFEVADALVRATRRGNYNLPELRLITQDASQLDPEGQAYIQDNPESVGVTFQDKENNSFDIWIHPQYTDWSSSWAQDTLLHELTHGYLGCYNHGDRFRRFLGRVLLHYRDLVNPYFIADSLASLLVSRYCRDDTPEYQAMEIEAFTKAALDEREYVTRTLFKEMARAEGVVS